MTWRDWIGTVKQGDCLDMMKQMPEGVVHTTVTSIPYYGLRDYGIAPTKWPAVDYSPMPGLPTIHIPEMECCYGLEPTPEAYVGHGVLVFRANKRIMHPTGTLWLNMGDCYNQLPASTGISFRRDRAKVLPQFSKSKRIPRGHGRWGGGNVRTPDLKPKDLLEMPSRLVLALQADGWWLRSRIPWLKRNAMPESCRDRPTQAVEYVFLLTKSPECFYDGEAVRVPAARIDTQTFGGAKARRNKIKKGDPRYRGGHEQWGRTVTTGEGGRSRRNSDWFFESWQGLWTDENGQPLAFIVNPKPYKRAHFATFPPGLVIPCIRAGTSERGACPECGSPWVRIVKKTIPKTRKTDSISAQERSLSGPHGQLSDTRWDDPIQTQTLGWRATCSCGHKETVPCLVADIFAGTGTVIEVARKMGRSSLGFEISEEYVKKYCAERLAQGVLGLKTEGT